MKTTNTHIYFWHGVFSQFDKTNVNEKGYQFKENGINYICAEQYMMYHKALFFGDVEIAKQILKENEPKKIKKLGREVKNFDAEKWNAVAKDIVINANYLKFSQNENLESLLIKYKDLKFVEASPYDCIWGVGLHYDDELILDEANWRGLNQLGDCIEQVKYLLINSN